MHLNLHSLHISGIPMKESSLEKKEYEVVLVFPSSNSSNMNGTLILFSLDLIVYF